jgi:hypothetical protein
MEFDITPLVLFVLGALFALAGQAAQWLSKYLYGLRYSVDSDWLWVVDALVATGVKAAEQVYRDHEAAGKDKMNYVIRYVEAELAARKLKVNRAVIEAKIEAAIYEMKQGIKPE